MSIKDDPFSLDVIDEAFRREQERTDGWLSNTSVGSRGRPRDLWGDRKPNAEQKEESGPKRSITQIAALGADEDEVELLLGDLEEELSDLTPMERLEVASRLEVAQRLWLEDKPQEALQLVLGGENLIDAEKAVGLFRESIDADEFDQWAAQRSAELAQENAQAVHDAIVEGVKGSPDLQTTEGDTILAGMLEAAGFDPTETTPEQVKELVDRAARAAHQAEVEEEKDAILAAFDAAVRDTAGATTEENENAREVWGVPEPSAVERELDHRAVQMSRIGIAALTDKKTAEESVDDAWESTVGQQEALAADWDAVQAAALDAAAEQAAEDAARGI